MSKEARNAAHIQKLSIAEMKVMFLEGFARDYFMELEISPHIDITRELSSAFALLTTEHQENFRQAVYQALVEAVPPHHELKVLIELVFLSAFVNAKCVIDYLNELLEPTSFLQQSEDKFSQRAQGAVGAVLRGFAQRKD